MLGCWRSERQQPFRGTQTGHGEGGGGCKGLRMGQAGTLTVSRRRRKKGAGACWGLEGEEVKKLGSRRRGNSVFICRQEELGPWSSLDKGQQLLPWQRCGTFSV